MNFPAPSAKITVFQRRANALEHGTGISNPARVYTDSAKSAISSTGPQGEPVDISFADQKRLWTSVKCDDLESCWEWQGYKLRGYGRIGLKVNGKHRAFPVHRVVFLMWGHLISTGLVLDHLCRNRACCNPTHLEPVENRVNILRGESPHVVNSRKLVCVRGHALEGGNVYVDSRGNRNCVICKRQLQHAWRMEKRIAERGSPESLKAPKRTGLADSYRTHILATLQAKGPQTVTELGLGCAADMRLLNQVVVAMLAAGQVNRQEISDCVQQRARARGIQDRARFQYALPAAPPACPLPSPDTRRR